jgi:hypothetical protein
MKRKGATDKQVLLFNYSIFIIPIFAFQKIKH